MLAAGVWGVLATPFHGSRLSLDETSLEHEVAFYRTLPVAGLVALGVFGECARLTSDEQQAVVAAVCRQRGQLPLVVGISERETDLAIEQVTSAKTVAADALAGVMVQINRDFPSAVVEHIRAIHDATGVGIVLQDYPVASGVHADAYFLAKIVESCEFLVAIKLEAPPTVPAIAQLRSYSDIPVFGGLGGVALLDELAAGAAGAMTGFSHPEALIATVSGYQQGGFSDARKAFGRWLPLINFEGQAGVGLAIRKEVLRRRGLIADASVRPPGAPLPAALRPLLEQHIEAVEGFRESWI